MLRASLTRILLHVLMMTMLAVIGCVSARAQSAAEINALVLQVDQLYAQGKYSEASALTERIVAAAEKLLGKDDPFLLAAGNNLAELYREQGRYTEAEPLYRRVVDASERLNGLEHPDTIAIISNLAELYHNQGRLDEAELLYHRVLNASERVLGKEHPDTLISVNNLAALYLSQRRYDDAEPLFRRALEASERVLGAEHPDTLRSVNSLAALYHKQRRYDDAEPLYRRAREARARVLGTEHPETLTSLNNLAKLYEAEGRYDEAEPLYSTVIEAAERVLGKEHPRTLASVSNMGIVHFSQRDWAGAAQFWGRSTAAIIQRTQRGMLNAGLTGNKQSEAEQSNWQFWGLVKALHRLTAEIPGSDPAMALRETFRIAQWTLGSEVAQSLAQMAARGTKGDAELAALVRERQDLVVDWQMRDGLRNSALGEAPDKRDAEAEAGNSARLAAVEGRLATIDQRLATAFPDYAALANPTPLSVEEVQAQLRADEALILFLDIDGRFTPTPEETFIWVVTKTELRWVRSDLGTAALTREVQALRCGLDEEEWATPSNARRCGDLLGLSDAPDASRPLPFHLGKAHALYQALFGQIEDMIAGKRLLIVPSGALTSLPFHALVTKAPETALPETFEGYQGVAWLGRNNAITTLPAVSSLSALRQHAANREPASDAYAGYGNPLLSGDGTSCRAAKVPDHCPAVEVAEQAAPATAPQTGITASQRATIRGGGGRRAGNATTDDIFAKGAGSEAVLAQVRGLCPLPDTAYEIKCVAERFAKNPTLIRLAGEAKETDIKALSESGQLARYRVLHFATHGLLSGDVERMANRQGEPALVLTPPATPADAEDDGLLMASEVAALKLNADWVVLSACNTAAGDQVGAQALSGLARAFFYAGGRAMLVSHWPVYSDAAVRLTTSAFAELERNPKAGRAEALQRAMNALMDDRSQPDNAHPAVWAPFVVVGEGGR